MKKIFIAVFLAIIVAVPIALYVAANYFFKKQLEYAVQELGLDGKISWDKSGINIFARSGYISSVKLGDITIDRITFSRYSYKTALTVQVDNLTVPVTTALGGLYDPAYLMGYSAFHIQSAISCTLSDTMLSISSDNTNIVEIGRPSFFLSFSDISSDRIIPAIISAAKQDKQLGEMRVTLDSSASVIARAIDALAMVTNSDHDQAKARLLDAISRHSATGPDASKQNLLQLHRLVDNPGAVAIQLTMPVQPKALLVNNISMSNIDAWRATGQQLLALPLSISTY